MFNLMVKPKLIFTYEHILWHNINHHKGDHWKDCNTTLWDDFKVWAVLFYKRKL